MRENDQLEGGRATLDKCAGVKRPLRETQTFLSAYGKQHLLAMCLQPPAQTGAVIDLEHVLEEEEGEGDRSSEGAEPAIWLKVREVFWRLIIFIFGPFRA